MAVKFTINRTLRAKYGKQLADWKD